MNYRIYQNIEKWEYVTTVSEKHLNTALSVFDGNTYILIIKHDIALNMDEPVYLGIVNDFRSKTKQKR